MKKSTLFHHKIFIIFSLFISCLSVFFLSAGLTGCKSASVTSKFQVFLDQCLKSFASDDFFTLHQLFTDPENYDIYENEISYFTSPSASFGQTSLESRKNTLEELASFEQDSLTPSEQKLYLLLKNKLTLSVEESENYPYYHSTLGKNGEAISLINSLYQYSFRNRKDIETYLSLLKEIPSYLDDLYSYEQQRLENGLTPDTSLLEDSISSLSSITNTDPADHLLASTFKERIKNVSSLKETDLDQYEEENLTLLKEALFPAYVDYQDKLSSLLSSSSYLSLCQYDKGKDYYNFLLRSNVGTDRTGDECKEILENMYEESLDKFHSISLENPDIFTEYYSTFPELTEASDIMESLRKNSLVDYPSIKSISYEILDYPEELCGDGSQAFYLASSLDASENSDGKARRTSGDLIYLNPNEKNSAELFGTLAHEGYPGHMYQTHYLYENLLHPTQLFMEIQGYEEGWATYAQMNSYDIFSFRNTDGSVTSQLQSLYKENALMTLCLCSLSDLYVNYEGHSMEELISWLKDYGISQENAETIYHHVISSPTDYLSYSIGYYELMDIRSECEKKEGYSLQDFHRQILDCGSCPFYLIRDMIELQNP